MNLDTKGHVSLRKPESGFIRKIRRISKKKKTTESENGFFCHGNDSGYGEPCVSAADRKPFF